MVKSVDYMYVYEKEKRELEKEVKKEPVKAPEIDREIKLLAELIDKQSEQYKKIKNQDKWDWVEQKIYPFLCDVAQIQGAKVELKIKEDEMIAFITYTGQYLLLANYESTEELNVFSTIIKEACEVTTSVEGQNFVIQFSFDLFTKQKIADNTKEIRELQRKIKENRMSNAILDSIFGKE